MAAQKPRAWLNSEVKKFLCLLAEDRIQTELIESTRNERIFKEISERMATCGYQRTPKQCREKLKKLKCDYRSLIDHNGVRVPNRKTWKWFDEMDAIYGHRAENNGREIGLDAASAQLESSIDNATMERSGRVGVTRWSHVETQALLAAWSEDGIQRELEESNRNEAVYGKISARLAAAGVSRSANQCRNKMKKFKQDYRQLKQQFMSDETMTSETFEWFYAMDSVIKDRPAAAIDDSTDQMTLELMISDVQTDSPSATNSETLSTSSSAMSSSNPFGRTKVMPTCSWSRKEVLALLMHWANPAIQQELRWSKRNIAVFNRLSAKLATLGFSKTAHNCQEKLRHLKQNYRRIKNSNPSEGAKKMWFNIIDRVLGSQPAASECAETAPSSSAEPIAPVVFSLNTNDEADWLPDEVQVLVTLWAQPNIQRQLHASGTHSVFTYLSSELALIGFNKTPQQCNLKVYRLKEMYKTIKQVEPHRNNGSDWFSVMDGVLGPEAATSRDANSAAAVIAPESAEDSCQAAWTPEEVDALLTLWAEESFQEQLKSTEGDERVYAQLSSELATQGFDKTTYQCRTKIRLLEQEYERFKEEKDSKAQKSSWFVIMDEILGCPKLDAETDLAAEPLQASHPAEGCRLSVPSLCLLVPTLRLMCAFAWQVVRCGNVAQYNKVEELVSLVTELAPELLTARERAQLLLRLRARLVLELCRSERVADLLDVQSHLRIIQKLMTSSGCDQEELEKSKSNFVEVVHTLLGDPQERIRFFVEVFPIHYGQQYEAALQTLVWKFISRVDNLLPVPDIKQTADWLSSAPSVMEECGQLVLEREQLKELLHFHEQQTGINNKCFSQAQNVFLPLLHLRPKTNPRQRAASVVENEGFSCGKDESLDKSLTNDTAEDFGTINNLQDNQSEGNRFCSSSPSGSKPQHRCSMCSYSDSRMAALLQHIRQEHLVQKSSPFTGTKDHASLSGDVLKDIVTPGSQGPPFQCDQCDKTYLSKRYLIVHRRIHTGETPFLCSICGQGFRSSFILKTHMRTHTGERPYMCPICGKTSVQHLARHMRMHRGEKNYLCTECGKAFLSSGELRLHMRHHTGERPYTCRQCGKGFIAKCQLTVHTRQHTGERPYRCPLCPKAFYTRNYLKRHLKSHSKKSYQCLKCMKTFRQEDTFNLHVKTHDLM